MDRFAYFSGLLHFPSLTNSSIFTLRQQSRTNKKRGPRLWSSRCLVLDRSHQTGSIQAVAAKSLTATNGTPFHVASGVVLLAPLGTTVPTPALLFLLFGQVVAGFCTFADFNAWIISSPRHFVNRETAACSCQHFATTVFAFCHIV